MGNTYDVHSKIVFNLQVFVFVFFFENYNVHTIHRVQI